MIGSFFRTDYDEPSAVLDLPADVTSGRDAGLCVVDQVVRGTAIVGRVTGDFGAVALKIRGTGRPVRVAVVVHLDELGTRWWSDRVRPGRHDPERPRLVLVRAQGEVRGAALLARRQGWRRAGGVQVRTEFDLAGDEVDRDGLLVVELAEPPLPSWSDGRVSPRSALGLRIDSISVREHTAPTADAAAPGSPGARPAAPERNVPAAFRLEIRPVPPAPPVPRSPSTRLTRRKPARAGFKVLRAARRAAVRAGAAVLPARPGADLGVLAIDLRTGVPLAVGIVGRRPGGLDVRLAAPAEGPVLIGLDAAHPGLSCRIRPA